MFWLIYLILLIILITSIIILLILEKTPVYLIPYALLFAFISIYKILDEEILDIIYEIPARNDIRDVAYLLFAIIMILLSLKISKGINNKLGRIMYFICNFIILSISCVFCMLAFSLQ